LNCIIAVGATLCVPAQLPTPMLPDQFISKHLPGAGFLAGPSASLHHSSCLAMLSSIMRSGTWPDSPRGVHPSFMTRTPSVSARLVSSPNCV
jgi:hypothetical protein